MTPDEIPRTLARAGVLCPHLGHLRVAVRMSGGDMGERKVYRDAVTGEYVTDEYAAEHPDTTVSERVSDDGDTAD